MGLIIIAIVAFAAYGIGKGAEDWKRSANYARQHRRAYFTNMKYEAFNVGFAVLAFLAILIGIAFGAS